MVPAFALTAGEELLPLIWVFWPSDEGRAAIGESRYPLIPGRRPSSVSDLFLLSGVWPMMAGANAESLRALVSGGRETLGACAGSLDGSVLVLYGVSRRRGSMLASGSSCERDGGCTGGALVECESLVSASAIVCRVSSGICPI